MPRILLIEDDPDVRLVMEHVLFDEGHRIDATASVAEAGEFLDRNDYDLVLTDGRLPDGNGLVLAEKARRQGVPTLIVTAYAFGLRNDTPEIDLANFDVLLKPVRPGELVEAVEKALGLRRG